jgi:type IV secretion system protein VirB9
VKRLLAIALMIPAFAWAELTPQQGIFDPRVRVVDYNPLNVVKLSTFYGVSTHVQFGDGETIRDVAVGDDQAWKIVPRGNHLFIKPQATKAGTNVTVVTDKRTYQFALVVTPRPLKDSTAWRDPNLIYSLSFRYPDEEAAKIAEKTKSEAVKSRLGEVKSKLAEARKEGQNLDYWVAGSKEVSPTAARDDGRFIYLTFNNNRDMPAIYSVDEGGNETLINTNVVDGNTIVVQRMVRQLRLRKGNAVACVINKAFDLDGGTDNTTGTVAPDVERVIKGAQ